MWAQSCVILEPRERLRCTCKQSASLVIINGGSLFNNADFEWLCKDGARLLVRGVIRGKRFRAKACLVYEEHATAERLSISKETVYRINERLDRHIQQAQRKTIEICDDESSVSTAAANTVARSASVSTHATSESLSSTDSSGTTSSSLSGSSTSFGGSQLPTSGSSARPVEAS